MLDRRDLSRATIRAACLLGVLVATPLVATPEGETLDTSVCATCHEDQVKSLLNTSHALLDQAKWHPGKLENASCSACHGNLAAHIESGGDTDTTGTQGASAADRSRSCLECHGDDHGRFPASPHGAAALDCSSCHSVHGGARRPSLLKLDENPPPALARAGAATTTCAGCHPAVIAEFQSSERHRLQEGILSCVSCHNPHEAQDRVALGAFKQQLCITCHADKGGPHVFEHGSQRVEGCTACHTPHGSSNRHMLKTQRVAELCFSCHATVPGFHSRFTLETNCTNCHSTIHGSNLDPAFLK